TAQGLCVRISSLSPFTITWERFPEVSLPQTGDSSRPGLWLALGLACAAALAVILLRGRKSQAQ
ncbi:MAG: LPXTG cell wall anchor domain-containing protein, partial [Aristaeellaceae bacterium]